MKEFWGCNTGKGEPGGTYFLNWINEAESLERPRWLEFIGQCTRDQRAEQWEPLSKNTFLCIFVENSLWIEKDPPEKNKNNCLVLKHD